MPLPTPNDDESQDVFMARCLPALAEDSDYADQEQRVAALLGKFRSASKGVKVLNEATGLLGGYGIPYGGPVVDKNHAAGKDLDGEFFHEGTNLCLDWFPEDNRPVLYDHGQDPDVKLEVVGRQVSKSVDPKRGVWVETQLNLANSYAKYILDLAKRGVLAYSSGALAGYVRRGKNGAIDQWPWIEQTLTVRPANPYALIAADAVKHLKAADALPAELAALVPDEEPAPSLGEALKAGLETPADPPENKAIGDLKAIAAHLEEHGWSNKAGRTMSARNLGQMHQSIKAMGDLHAATCDMGTDCPMYDAAASKAQTPGDPAAEASRQEMEEYLAGIKLGRGTYHA